MKHELSEGDAAANLRLGPTLRSLRKGLGYTLEEVAQRTGLSTSFLILLENNKTAISLACLQRIAHFYGVSVSDLFTEERQHVRRVVRLKDPLRVASPADGIVVLGIADDPQRTMEPFDATIEPGAGYSEPVVHEGEEFVHVLEGHIHVRLGDEEYDLAPGDTIYHTSTIPHVYHDVGATRANIIGCSKHIPFNEHRRR